MSSFLNCLTGLNLAKNNLPLSTKPRLGCSIFFWEISLTLLLLPIEYVCLCDCRLWMTLQNVMYWTWCSPLLLAIVISPLPLTLSWTPIPYYHYHSLFVECTQLMGIGKWTMCDYLLHFYIWKFRILEKRSALHPLLLLGIQLSGQFAVILKIALK